jgi:cobalt/nickel transport system ATP-binding protein
MGDVLRRTCGNFDLSGEIKKRSHFLLGDKMSVPVFDLIDVGYHFAGQFTALQDINLKVQPGERVTIVGANGSGKSTLLHILDGLIFPTSGEVWAFGHRIKEKGLREGSFTSFFRSRVGLLFQNPDIQLFCPTVLDEIAFGPLQLDCPQEEAVEKSQEMMKMLGLEKIAKRPPHQLSGGEKKRVALASVLAVNPDVLLLDEPTGGLDPRTQVWLVEVLNELHSLGKTIITATHDLSILEDISDRAVVMTEGHTIVAEGAPHEILDDLALLLRVNLIHAHIHTHEDLIHSHGHYHFFTHRHEHEK